ncbi:phosphoribosylformylglycinamidine synthase I [candidate division KSB1 bacterium]|nr:phosphoribosylformylglycinamidine synthase I [candidate division KSB1 bacterium]
MKPRVKILYSPGNNCHFETAEAFKMAGAEPEICNMKADLFSGRDQLDKCDLLALPGGFSWGDHLAAARIWSLDLVYRMKDQLQAVKEKQIPILGICNGFQALINTGLLPGSKAVGAPSAIVDRNNSAVFESRWVTCGVQDSDCVWTQGLAGEEIRMPVAHGEGRVLLAEGEEQHTVLKYGSVTGTQDYPANPNGSPEARAGICDPTGRILGLMPHPERAIYPWHGSEDGIKIFKAGVNAVK